MSRILFSFLVFLSLLISFPFVTSDSRASVFIGDMTVGRSVGNGFTSGVINTGSSPGSYEIVVCGTESEGVNQFNLPIPGSWTELNNTPCDNASCQLGIWGRFVDSGVSEEISCSWNLGTRAFTAATIRYTGINTDNPIIDMACSDFIDDLFVIGPVSSEPGAQILTIQLTETLGGTNEPFADFNQSSGIFNSGINFGDVGLLALGGSSVLDQEGIGFPGVQFLPLSDVFNTKLCVITLRMSKADVPALNIWGVTSLAAALGIVALLVVRKRKLQL